MDVVPLPNHHQSGQGTGFFKERGTEGEKNRKDRKNLRAIHLTGEEEIRRNISYSVSYHLGISSKDKIKNKNKKRKKSPNFVISFSRSD